MNFIVDISSRQSGKTTRLIKFAAERILFGKPCLIITPSSRQADYVKDELDRYLHYKHRELYEVVGCDNLDVIKGKANISDLNISMILYDDFDVYIDKIDTEWLTLKGYYTTTPLVRSIKECVSNLITKLYGK
jgi:hypothetical protein